MMTIFALNLDLKRVLAPVPIWRADVTRADWLSAAHAVREAGGRLLALWGGAQAQAPTVCVAYVMADGLVWLTLALSDGQSSYPDLAPYFPATASRRANPLYI